jgi:hypothetical protein
LSQNRSMELRNNATKPRPLWQKWIESKKIMHTSSEMVQRNMSPFYHVLQYLVPSGWKVILLCKKHWKYI